MCIYCMQLCCNSCRVAKIIACNSSTWKHGVTNGIAPTTARVGYWNRRSDYQSIKKMVYLIWQHKWCISYDRWTYSITQSTTRDSPGTRVFRYQRYRRNLNGAVGLCSNVLSISTDACCLVIALGVQRDMVDFAWGSVARSIGVSRYIFVVL